MKGKTVVQFLGSQHGVATLNPAQSSDGRGGGGGGVPVLIEPG